MANGHHGGNNHNHGHHHDGSTPPVDTPPVDTPPTTTPPDNSPSTFADLGATFNDATRALVGGLWQNTVEEGGQGLGSVFQYGSDLQAVQTGLLNEVKAGDFTGDTLTHVQSILTDLATAQSAATASVNGGGTFGSVAAAEAALRTSHLDILDIVQNDPTLAGLATQNGATGFQPTPATLPDGVTAANAPHTNLAEIGAIFNDAASQILGGVNADNKGVITNDINAVMTDLQQLMTDNPLLFGGLTGVHAEAVVRQLQLENNFISQAGISPDAGRASNDNILDIIDIIQGDTNLANMANQGGVQGFSPFPDAAAPTPRYTDDAAQTNFWANFIAQSNTLGQQANQLVGSTDTAGITTLINDLHTFQKNVTDFDAAQGGLFEARFDNELLGDTSTLGAEVTKMIQGLQDGNAALVGAAADEMHANAADVSGNNVPVTGGTYNPDGLTVAEVLQTATGGDAATAANGTAAPAANGTATPVAADPAAAGAANHDPAAAATGNGTATPAATDTAATGTANHDAAAAATGNGTATPAAADTAATGTANHDATAAATGNGTATPAATDTAATGTANHDPAAAATANHDAGAGQVAQAPAIVVPAPAAADAAANGGAHAVGTDAPAQVAAVATPVAPVAPVAPATPEQAGAGADHSVADTHMPAIDMTPHLQHMWG